MREKEDRVLVTIRLEDISSGADLLRILKCTFYLFSIYKTINSITYPAFDLILLHTMSVRFK